MATDRTQQPAVMRRRIEALEAHLAAEKAAHAKTFGAYRDVLHELVDLQLRQRRAAEALAGEIR